MSTHADKVREFYEKYQQEQFLADDGAAASLEDMGNDRVDLRMKLIAEEFFELVAAVYNEQAAYELESAWNGLFSDGVTDERRNDVVAAADATGDLRYVIEGFDLEAGIPAEKVFDEIHSSNLSKLGKDGFPIISDGTLKPKGKILKGEDFFEPDLKAVIEGREPDHTPARLRK
jgi:hypothetical protein